MTHPGIIHGDSSRLPVSYMEILDSCRSHALCKRGCKALWITLISSVQHMYNGVYGDVNAAILRITSPYAPVYSIV